MVESSRAAGRSHRGRGRGDGLGGNAWLWCAGPASDYRVGMAFPAEPSRRPELVASVADSVAIRACLAPRLLAEFGAEWDSALEKAKASKDLAGVHGLLDKWRHWAYAEMCNPGSYDRLLARLRRSCTSEKNRLLARSQTCKRLFGSGSVTRPCTASFPTKL
jgi:hypothetical protein